MKNESFDEQQQALYKAALGPTAGILTGCMSLTHALSLFADAERRRYEAEFRLQHEHRILTGEPIPEEDFDVAREYAKRLVKTGEGWTYVTAMRTVTDYYLFYLARGEKSVALDTMKARLMKGQ